MDWRGRPLSCHEVIVQTIAATTTATGLRVHAELDTSAYDTGVKISDAQMGALPLTRHDWHGDWNYTLLPRTTTRPAALPIRSTSPGLAWPGCAPGADRPAAQQWDAAGPPPSQSAVSKPNSTARLPMFPRPSVKHQVGLNRQSSGGTRHRA